MRRPSPNRSSRLHRECSGGRCGPPRIRSMVARAHRPWTATTAAGGCPRSRPSCFGPYQATVRRQLLVRRSPKRKLVRNGKRDMRRLLDRVTRTLRLERGADDGAQTLVDAEWLVTNGLGGYASGSVAGVNTRRYHGLLVAALPNPVGRLVMLNHLGERVCVAGGTPTALGGEERVTGGLDRDVARRLVRFRLEAGLPAWGYEGNGARIEKRLFLP